MSMSTPSESALPTVGVIIVSYNTADLLQDCLHSLAGCSLPLRVVVIDNCSPDGSAAQIEAAFPDVHLVALDQNIGFAAANNRGLCLFGLSDPGDDAANLTPEPVPPLPADAPPVPYLLLLNPDTVVQPGAIETLVAFLAAHPRVGMVGPRLLNPDGTVQPAAFRFPTLSMSLLEVFPPGEVLPGRLYGSWLHGRYPEEQSNQLRPFALDHPLGAAMLVRRQVVAEVGLLDAGYFMYSEEVDWCWRIRQAGWAIWQVPTAQIVHIGGAATGQFRHRMLVALHVSRVRFFRKHYRPPFQVAHRWITRIGLLRLILLAWWAYTHGAMSQAELRARLWAYAQITR